MADSVVAPKGGRPLRSEFVSAVTAVRFSPAERARISAAARMNFTTPSDFIRSAALLAVDDTLESDELSAIDKPA